MTLTNWSVDRPRTAFATILLVVLMLASGAMHLQFDNSEDGFFPDDPSVDLLNEVESEYRSNIDFIRVISEISKGRHAQSIDLGAPGAHRSDHAR